MRRKKIRWGDFVESTRTPEEFGKLADDWLASGKVKPATPEQLAELIRLLFGVAEPKEDWEKPEDWWKS